MNEKYTLKIDPPVYEPSGHKPKIADLHKLEKFNTLMVEIDRASVSDEEKNFLRMAAYRHVKFNYSKIADYYAHASPEMQTLMENSALVIIDLESAIKNGFVYGAKQIRDRYLNEYAKQ